jgi:hypothetical protein
MRRVNHTGQRREIDSARLGDPNMVLGERVGSGQIIGTL